MAWQAYKYVWHAVGPRPLSIDLSPHTTCLDTFFDLVLFTLKGIFACI